MRTITENTFHDSLSGAVFAIEGIKDACVVLNGPTGCKFYHAAISDSQYMRGLTFEPSKYSDSYYMGQARVPCTYLDGHDYVFGSGEKLKDILKLLDEESYGLIAVINTPGAALIGDDLDGFLEREVTKTPCFSIENTGYSGKFSEGHQKAVLAALRNINMMPRKESEIRKKTVNFLGFSIYQKYFEQNYQALKSLLALCGISVIAAPGAGDCVEMLSQMAEAELNIVVFPEYGHETAVLMENTYGIPFISLDEGLPIGFDGTMSFITQVCRRVGANPHSAMSKVNEARARAYLHLARYSSLLGLPKGATFGIKAESSVCYALTKWLCSYLGMIPAAISVLPDRDDLSMQKLTDFLRQIDCLSVMEAPFIETPMHILFADGSTIAQARLNNKKVCGVELSLPSLGYLDVTDKYILGENGALFLLEQILNGLRFLL